MNDRYQVDMTHIKYDIYIKGMVLYIWGVTQYVEGMSCYMWGMKRYL